MPGFDFFMQPKVQEINISTEEVHNALYSLMLLNDNGEVSGLDPQIDEIRNDMSDELKKRNNIVMKGLFYAVVPYCSFESFENYLAYLRNIDAVTLKDQLLDVYKQLYRDKFKSKIENEVILKDEQSFINFLNDTYSKTYIDEHIERQAYKYILDPSKLKDLIVFHLKEMWDLYLKLTWGKNRNVLEESVQAYKNAGIESLSKSEVVKYIGCEVMDCDWESFINKVKNAKTLHLVPSIHLGPYLGKLYHHKTNEMWLFYGSLVPEGSVGIKANLSKADLLIHLGAMTDGIRLEILKITSTGKEFSSTDFMQILDISQSAVSRHLKQLSATGFLTERRENSSKLYKINKNKLEKTMSFLTAYLEINPNSF